MNPTDLIDNVPDLVTFAWIDWDREPWQFNETQIFRHTETGELYYADDSGCSCPTPFEMTTVGDLAKIDRVGIWDDLVLERNGGAETYYDPDAPNVLDPSVLERAAEIRRLISDHLREQKGNR